MRHRALPPLVLFAILGVWACGGKSEQRNEDGGEAGDGGTTAGGSGNAGGVSGTSSGGASGTRSGGTSSGGVAGTPSGGTSSGGVSGTVSGGTTSGGSTTGGSSTGGTSGTGTCPTCTPQMCTTVTPPTALINDFDNLYFSVDGDQSFGIFGVLDEAGMQKPDWWLHFFSGSYAYPMIPQSCSGEPTPPYPLARDEMTGVLRVAGTVGGPSGFGVWLGPCIIDMSSYAGVRFAIGGRTGTGVLEMKIGTSSNTDPNECQIGRGKCTTDLCAPPSLRLPIPDSAAIIAIPWTAFNGGLPAATVDPGEVVEIRWDFEWAIGMTPYPVDVTLDDVMLFE